MATKIGPLAVVRGEPRQARKGAAVSGNVVVPRSRLIGAALWPQSFHSGKGALGGTPSTIPNLSASVI